MIEVFSTFSGYGADLFALKQLGLPFKCVGISEIDKHAIKIHELNHGKIKNYGDISKIVPEEVPDFNLLTAGFCCQSFSISGKRLGELDPRGTLFWDVLRIAKVKKPKYMLLENVKGLLSIDDGRTFEKMIHCLREIGYDVCHKVLNSKDYGVPQNRERVWFVCKLGTWDFMEFQFPNKEPLKLFLKDVLEKEVDESYFLSERAINGINKSNFKERQPIDINNPCRTLKVGGDVPCFVDEIVQLNMDAEFDRERIYSVNGISPTLTCTVAADNKILLNTVTRDFNIALDVAKKLELEKNEPQQIDIYHLKHGKEDRPLTTYIPQDSNVHRCLQAGEPKEVLITNQRIRRLTPKECFRLQGFLRDEIIIEGIAKSHLYHLAGNGWTVSVAAKIFKSMFKGESK